MKLGLLRDTQTALTGERLQWRLYKRGAIHSRQLERLQLRLQGFRFAKQVAVKVLKGTINCGALGDLVEPSNRVVMRLNGQPGAFLSVKLFDLVKSAIEHEGNVRCCVERLSASGLIALHYHNFSAMFQQPVGGQQTCYSRADNTNLSLDATLQGWELVPLKT
jgi:hypothetical protein